LAFVIGVGWWRGHTFEVEQLVLRSPGHEPEMLARLDQLLADCGALVSYNGRAFDVPLLRTRYLMNRRPAGVLERPHLDLLAPARQLFARRAIDCRLTTLETVVLRRPRGQDLSGADIPSRYRAYLRTRDPAALRAVLEHNRRDVIATGALLTETLRRLADPLEWAEDGDELFAAARLWARVGDTARADAALARGLAIAGSRPARRRLLRLRARLARRCGDAALARSLWAEYSREFPEENMGYVEVAKLCEHRLRDLGGALYAVEQAPLATEALVERRGRLQRRIAKHVQSGSLTP
jgi:hypothetical protein